MAAPAATAAPQARTDWTPTRAVQAVVAPAIQSMSAVVGALTPKRRTAAAAVAGQSDIGTGAAESGAGAGGSGQVGPPAPPALPPEPMDWTPTRTIQSIAASAMQAVNTIAAAVTPKRPAPASLAAVTGSTTPVAKPIAATSHSSPAPPFTAGKAEVQAGQPPLVAVEGAADVAAVESNAAVWKRGLLRVLSPMGLKQFLAQLASPVVRIQKLVVRRKHGDGRVGVIKSVIGCGAGGGGAPSKAYVEWRGVESVGSVSSEVADGGDEAPKKRKRSTAIAVKD